MGVLNWMQSRLHGSHHSKKKPEFSADSAQLADVDASGGLPRTGNLNDGWIRAMLSIGTREEHRLKSCGRLDELSTLQLQDELKSLVRAKGGGAAEEIGRGHHMQPPLRLLKRSSSNSNKHRSFRKAATRAFGGFLSRPSFRETVPEMRFDEVIWGLLLKKAHPENSAFCDTAIGDHRAVHMGCKGKAEIDEEGGRWIRTDSEYIVLEI